MRCVYVCDEVVRITHARVVVSNEVIRRIAFAYATHRHKGEHHRLNRRIQVAHTQDRLH